MFTGTRLTGYKPLSQPAACQAENTRLINPQGISRGKARIPERIILRVCFVLGMFLALGQAQVSAQCDVVAQGVLTYCNSFVNGTVLTDSFFVGFRVISLNGDTLDVVDLEGNGVTNRGKRVDNIATDEPDEITVQQVMISGAGDDTTEFWYFGPFANGDAFDIVLVDPNGECDTVFVAAGTFTCEGQSPQDACDTTVVPLWFLDFTATEFTLGGGEGAVEDIDEVFLVMERTREADCCDLGGASERCFEFIVRLDEDDIGILIDDVGSGSSGGYLYADSLAGFTCTGDVDMTWPFQQDNGQSSDILPLCLVSGVRDYIVLSCKAGGNTTSASIGAVKAPFAAPEVTIEPCDVVLEVFQADTVTWASDDDPNLDNFVMCSGDSTVCEFLYNEAVFGPVTQCAGDTFYYYAGAMPQANQCFDTDTTIFDTTFVVVYPVFTVEIDSHCTNGQIMLSADVTDGGLECSYDFAWSNGAMTQSILVDADGTEYSVTVTRSDILDEVAECVVVSDTINADPVIQLDCSNIADMSFQCPDDIPAPDESLVIVTGCGTPADTMVTDVSNGGGGCTGDTLFVTRHYIVDLDGDAMTTDDQDTCTQVFTVVDNTAPMITCPADVTVECNAGTDPGNTGMATATDNCTASPAITFSDTVDPGNCAEGGIMRTWIATDDCGNTATCIQLISLDDTTPPDITCPGDVTISCDESTSPDNTGSATATDNCTANPTITFTDDVTPSGICMQTFTITRTFTAIDDCGNPATCSQTITVEDNTPPVITCPADVTVDCDASSDPGDTGVATATDNCDSSPVITFSDSASAGGCTDEQTIMRTWMATDACGNTATCIQSITVRDSTPPSIACPADVTLECDENTDPGNTGSATATDNCDASPAITFSDSAEPGACANAQTIFRTWMATDDCGNTATCVQTLVVDDTTPAVLNCPPDMTIDCEVTPDPATTGMATATDNCGAVQVTYSDAESPGDCGDERNIARTWMATDACGNTSTCMQQITLQDTTPPTAVCQDITVDFMGNDTVTVTAGMIDNGSFDNCGDVTLSINQDTFVCTEVENQMMEVTLTVTDECGLESTCTANIMFTNGSQLSLTCPDTVLIIPPPGVCEVEVMYNVVAEDACGATVFLEQIDTSGITHGDIVPVDTMFIQMYRAYNLSGDTLTCSFPVIIPGQPGGDDMACRHALNLSLDQDCKATITPELLLIESRGCDADLVVSPKDTTFELIDGNMVDDSFVGMTIPVMVTDLISGNACWTFVTVEDKLAPELTCGSDTVFCYESVDPLDLGFPVDDLDDVVVNPDGSYLIFGIAQCGPVLFEYFDEISLQNCNSPFSRIIKRHWTATDANGNSSQCTDTIYVERVGLEGITLPPHFDNVENPSLECSNEICILPDGTPDMACTGAPGGAICDHIHIDFEDVFVPKCGGSYKVLRQWEIIDFCTGDEIIYVQKILVEDTTPPEVVCPDTLTISSSGPECTGMTVLPLPTVNDNCSEYDIQIFAPSGTLHENNGQFAVSGLTFGCHAITFVVTDACFNVSSCELIVCVEDQTEPVAVCDEHTIIGLAEPVTLIPAESLSDGSYDACGPVSFMGRRMTSCIDFDWTTDGSDSDEIPDGIFTSFDAGTEFQTEIPFTCCDIGIPVMVEVKVTDASGNVNTCMVEVTTQDKTAPEIECPPDFTVNCDFIFDEDALFDIDDRTYGTVLNGTIYSDLDRLPVLIEGELVGYDGIASDLCNLNVTLEVDDQRNNCGLGDIRRTFNASDGVNTVSCTQIITVNNEDPFNEEDNIVWPADTTLTGTCDVDITVAGEPVIINADCDLVGVTFSDLVIPFTPNACAKVIRTWQVIDWCTYSTGQSGLWMHDQVIKILNTEGPTAVEEIADLVLCQDDPEVTVDDPGACMANVALSLDVQDDCTAPEDLSWGYRVDLWGDGEFDIISPSFDAGEGGSVVQGDQLSLNITLTDIPMNDGADPEQVHLIQWIVEDHCGNVSELNQPLRLNDCKAPNVICRDLIAALNGPEDMVTIWASDFNASSTDNCTDTMNLVYSFSGTEVIPSMTFTCADVVDNGSAEFLLDVWVIDEYGNGAFCTVSFTLDGADTFCGLMMAQITGHLATQTGEQVKEAEVDIVQGDTPLSQTMSDVGGDYGFSELPMHTDYVVTPFKNDKPRYGVSTMDLIAMQKHILGLEPFDSPYKYIAADVNNSESVSALDMLELRRLILGVYTAFPDNYSWRFVPTQFEFADVNAPWPFDESIMYANLTASAPDGDFFAVKIGDVNGSFVANAQNVATRSPDIIELVVEDRPVASGKSLLIPLEIRDTRPLMGLQVAFSGKGLRFRDVHGIGKIDVRSEHTVLAESGAAVSWNVPSPVEDSGKGLALIAEARADGLLSELLTLTEDLMRAEAYVVGDNGDIVAKPLFFRFVAPKAEGYDFALYQNSPNPWTGETRIGFELPGPLLSELTVYDITGRVITRIEHQGVAGYNEITLDESFGNATSVMYYRLSAGDYSATKKMVRSR